MSLIFQKRAIRLVKKIYFQILWLLGLIKNYFYFYMVSTVSVKDSDITCQKLLFLFSHKNSNREDYNEEFFQAFRNAKVNARLIDIVENKFSLIALLRNILFKLKLIKFQGNSKALFSLSSNNVTILEIQNSMHEFSGIVTFCDCFGLDHLLTKAANKFGKQTYTMQHGFYWMSSYPRRENIAFKYFISDYILAWGQATVDEGEIAGIDRDRFIIQGKLRKQIKKDLIETSSIGVFLNASVDRIHNEKMIRICSDVGRAHNLPIIIYKHPSDTTYYDYDRDIKVINDNERLLNASFKVFISSGVVLDFVSSENIFFFDCESLPNSLKAHFYSFGSSSELSKFINQSEKLAFRNFTYISEDYSSFDFLGKTNDL